MEWKPGATRGQVVAGGNGEGKWTDQLSRPTDVILDTKTDTLIICDFGNERVVRWSRQGGTRGTIIITNLACYSLIMGDNGLLYVFEVPLGNVGRWSLKDDNWGPIVAVNSIVPTAPHYIFRHELVTFGGHHPVYVSNRTTRIIKWTDNAPKDVVVDNNRDEATNLSQLSYPQGLVVDQLGTIYVADRENDRIVRWLKGTTKGSVVVGGNGVGEEPNQLHDPFSLSFDRFGNLYVTDRENDRVQRFNIERNS